MDYKYINQLLDRYWKGETSLEEEQILRSFFSQICVPEELAKYRPLFNYEQTETKTDRLGDDFDERIMSMIVLTLTQAAQLSFQSNDASNTAMPEVYSTQPVPGVSVALNDSAHLDSVKKTDADAVPQQLEQHDISMLK